MAWWAVSFSGRRLAKPVIAIIISGFSNKLRAYFAQHYLPGLILTFLVLKSALRRHIIGAPEQLDKNTGLSSVIGMSVASNEKRFNHCQLRRIGRMISSYLMAIVICTAVASSRGGIARQTGVSITTIPK
jgi:hypothetical protein